MAAPARTTTALLCATLEIFLLESFAEPAAAEHFSPWEIDRPFILQDVRGVGNTPVWQRGYGSEGLVDRIEFREGAHWTLVRHQNTLNIWHTKAIAGGVPLSTDPGAVHGGGSVSAQLPPAGLTFYAPRLGAWGTVPDAFRPFASYQFHCRAASMAPLGARSLAFEPWIPETQQ
jgi:hypothetical protein